MRNLFRSGAAFLIIGGFNLVVAALTGVQYLLTGNGSVAIPLATLASGMGCLVIGIAVRSKNTK